MRVSSPMQVSYPVLASSRLQASSLMQVSSRLQASSLVLVRSLVQVHSPMHVSSLTQADFPRQVSFRLQARLPVQVHPRMHRGLLSSQRHWQGHSHLSSSTDRTTSPWPFEPQWVFYASSYHRVGQMRRVAAIMSKTLHSSLITKNTPLILDYH